MPSQLIDALVADVEKLDSTEFPAGKDLAGLFTALAHRLEGQVPELVADALAPPAPAAPIGMSADQIQAQGQAAVAAGAGIPPVVGSPTAAEDAATIANQNAELAQLKAELAQRPPASSSAPQQQL